MRGPNARYAPQCECISWNVWADHVASVTWHQGTQGWIRIGERLLTAQAQNKLLNPAHIHISIYTDKSSFVVHYHIDKIIANNNKKNLEILKVKRRQFFIQWIENCCWVLIFSITHSDFAGLYEHSWAAGRSVIQWHGNKMSVHNKSHRFSIARMDKTAERVGVKEREPLSEVLFIIELITHFYITHQRANK